MGNNVHLSIIVPVFNEQGNLSVLNEQIDQVMSGLDLVYELIFIDDGSTDSSAEELKQISAKDKAVKIITLERNYGQTQAIAAGVDNAKGDLIITMDADLQNDPKDIPRLIDKLNQGYDVVSGWRKKRKDGWKKKLPSYWANLLCSKMTRVKLHDIGCTLKIYRKKTLEQIDFNGDMHRFLPLCAAIGGAKIAEITVAHHARKKGRSKYGFGRFFKVIIDMMAIIFSWKFMKKPMHFFGSIGVASIALSGAIGLFILIRKVFLSGVWVSPLLFVFVIFFLMGIQFILMGIIAEFIFRVYLELNGMKRYKIKK